MNAFLYRSEFRRNKQCDDIVYYSEAMDAIIRVTKEQFLADNPGLTEQDFEFYKRWSDSDLEKLYWNDRKEGRRHCALDEIPANKLHYLLRKRWQEVSDVSMDFEHLLTPAQLRRLVLHSVIGLTTVKIAEMEGCNQSVVSRSIAIARKKLYKYFGD